MPRYKFAWSNLPAPLLKQLRLGLGVEAQMPSPPSAGHTVPAQPKSSSPLDGKTCWRNGWLTIPKLSRR